MEKLIDMEQKILISELNQGKELAEQLLNHLQPSSSQAAGIHLIQKILTSYEKALSVLNTVVLAEEAKSTIGPKYEASKQDFKDKDVSKKRKVMPKWSEQVKICSGSGLEGPVDDGYNWRKYGQKDILGARFPRGYFRCSHRLSQGCLATKQVQKSDEDPTVFEITYKGRHTCHQIPYSAATPLAKEAINQHNKEPHQQQQQPLLPKQEVNPMKCEDSSFSFGADGVRVKSENLDVERGLFFPPFPFPSPTIGFEIRENGSTFRENMMENELVGSFSLSPSASESEYFFGLCDDYTDQTLNSVTKIGDLEEYHTFENLEFFC